MEGVVFCGARWFVRALVIKPSNQAPCHTKDVCKERDFRTSRCLMDQGFLSSFLLVLLSLTGLGVPHLLNGREVHNSSEDRLVIDVFFRNLFTTSSAGYVLFGDKPVFLSTIPGEDYVFPGTDRHRLVIEAVEALTVINKLNYNTGEQNYFICCKSKKDFDRHRDFELLIVNKPALLKVLNKNLVLFQYKFGARVSPDVLQENILSPNKTFFSAYNGKLSLIGILLGYGTHNSLLYDRGIDLIKSTKTPVRSCLTRPHGNILSMTDAKITPGLTYNSLNEETNDIFQSMAHSTEHLNGTNTKIVFSYDPESNESIGLLSMYEGAQSIVEDTLVSENFLQTIAEKFGFFLPNAQTEISDARKWSNSAESANVLLSIAARSIYEDVSRLFFFDSSIRFFSAFVSGMRFADQIDVLPENMKEEHKNLVFFDVYRNQLTSQHGAVDIAKKLSSTFEKIQLKSKVKCIEPERLCIEEVRAGNGQPVSRKTKAISAHYLIKDSKGNTIDGNKNLFPLEKIDLTEVIPGFAHGVIGMRAHEIRNIYIHPEYAYGILSDYGLGDMLCVEVELLDKYDDENDVEYPELVPVGLANLMDINEIKTKARFEQLKERYVYFCGIKTWMHYKKKHFPLEKILEQIDSLCEKSAHKVQLSDFERSLLRRMHWNIYNNGSLH